MLLIKKLGKIPAFLFSKDNECLCFVTYFFSSFDVLL